MIPAQEALQRLKQGNARFIAASSSGESEALTINRVSPGELLDAQRPIAIVLACSDSRVPVELIFDQAIGDLFVVRVAGNIAGLTQLGSVEFAASVFGTRLVVVMGHTRCGAIQATIEEIQESSASVSPGIGEIVSKVRPAIEPLLNQGYSSERLASEGVRSNVRLAVSQLGDQSESLTRLRQDGLQILGAQYSLETGVVEFFEDGL